MTNNINFYNQNTYSPAFGNRVEKLITKLGGPGRNVTGQECMNLLKSFGFRNRQKGSHRIFTHPETGDSVIISVHNPKQQVKPESKKEIYTIIQKFAQA